MGSPRVTTYNPKKVTMALGNHIASGFADDSFISIEYAGDGVQDNTGADGEVVRSIDPSMSYTVKLVVQQNSRTNAFLDTLTIWRDGLISCRKKGRTTVIWRRPARKMQDCAVDRGHVRCDH